MIGQGVHLLVKLQARGTNKKTANKMKSFTGISDLLYTLFIFVMESI